MELCRQHGINADGVNSMILIRDWEVLTHSDAVLTVSSYLKAPWCHAAALRVIPRCLRDSVYGLISRSRQRLTFGRRSCELPDEVSKQRFLR